MADNLLLGTLAVIPARKGSKRLPRKNVLPLAGKPLIQWSIDEALNAKSVDLVVVTSDDEEVLEIAEKYQEKRIIPIKRPAELSSDTARSIDVVIHALHELESKCIFPKRVVLLQPTSPLRKASDIDAAISIFIYMSADSVVSVCEVEHPTAWCGNIDGDLNFEGFDLTVSRSQDSKKEYRLNGAIYIAATSFLKERETFFSDGVKAFVMDRKRSFDIDELLDFKMCEFFLDIDSKN